MSTLLEAPAFAADGTRRRHAVRLPAEPFDGVVHEAVLHQAVKTFLANQRQGTTETKTRSFVTGGNQKPWKQKGTGRARQGSTRSPTWPGGGTMFGPHPRDYRLAMPKKMRRMALRSALSARAIDHAVSVVEPLVLAEPKTRTVAALLDRMDVAGRKVLILTHGDNRNLQLSARNIPDVTVRRWQDANAYEVLRAGAVVIEEPALGTLEQGADLGDAPAPRVKAPKAPKAPKPPKAEAEPKAAKAAAKKPAAKKPAAKKAPAKAAKKPAAKPAAKAAAAKAKKPSRKKD